MYDTWHHRSVRTLPGTYYTTWYQGPRSLYPAGSGIPTVASSRHASGIVHLDICRIYFIPAWYLYVHNSRIPCLFMYMLCYARRSPPTTAVFIRVLVCAAWFSNNNAAKVGESAIFIGWCNWDPIRSHLSGPIYFLLKKWVHTPPADAQHNYACML